MEVYTPIYGIGDILEGAKCKVTVIGITDTEYEMMHMRDVTYYDIFGLPMNFKKGDRFTIPILIGNRDYRVTH